MFVFYFTELVQEFNATRIDLDESPEINTTVVQVHKGQSPMWKTTLF